MLKRLLFITVYLLIYSITHGQSLVHYHHNSFWGRIVLSDKFSQKLKWEVLLQMRTQNDPEDKANLFKHHQLTSYWLWIHYQVAKDFRVSVTPFCYFNTIALYPQPAELGNRGIKELRWAAQLEHTQRLRYFNFSNRYSLEYRYRDLQAEGYFEPNFRVRYRAKMEKSIHSGKHPINLIFYDEVFLEFGKAVKNSPAVFNQNRLYTGFSYDIAPNIKASLGYMYLIQERPSGAALDFSNVIWGILTFDNLFSQFMNTKSEKANHSK